MENTQTKKRPAAKRSVIRPASILVLGLWIYLVRADLTNFFEGIVQVARSGIVVIMTGIAAASITYVMARPAKVKTTLMSAGKDIGNSFRDVYDDLRGTRR